MRKCILLCLVCLMTWSVSAIERVTFEQLRDGGWQRLQDRMVQITTPLYLCGIYYDSLVLAPERMYVPEECAVGLADGDSTMYWQLVRQNAQNQICLQSRASGYQLRTGATIRNLRARVVSPGRLVTGDSPRFRHTHPSPCLPRLGKTDIRVCSANIQNFFYDLGGYASRKTTRGQFDLQCLKVATALRRMNADIYALCELERGDAAPRALVDQMNELAHKDVYRFVSLGGADGDTISVGYIYRQDRVAPFGEPRFAYHNREDIYAYRFVTQGWQTLQNQHQLNSGQTQHLFYISLNHLRSKRGEPAVSNQKRMANVDSILTSLRELEQEFQTLDSSSLQNVNSYSPSVDILLLGDYNSYTQEAPIQAFVRAGFQDVLMRDDSLGYSYVYDSRMGYLDRCFASPSMANKVTAVHPVHWNADMHYTYGFKSKYNYRNRQIPTESIANPSSRNIRRHLSRQGRSHLFYRYADHDPLLIGIGF